MKLTPQIARELNKKGAKISPKQIIRKEVEKKITELPQTIKEPEVRQSNVKEGVELIKYLIPIMSSNIENTNEIIKLNSKISQIMEDMVNQKSEPKQLKKWQCTVGRVDGSISTININEVR